MRTSISYKRTPGYFKNIFNMTGSIVNWVKNNLQKTPQYKLSSLYIKTVIIDIIKAEDFPGNMGFKITHQQHDAYDKLYSFITKNCDRNTDLIINVVEGFNKANYSLLMYNKNTRVDLGGLNIRNLTINQNQTNRSMDNSNTGVQPFALLTNIIVLNSTSFNTI